MKTLKIMSGVFFLCMIYGNSYALKREKVEELSVEYTKTDVSCFGKTDGTVEIQICGGKAPYIVVWDNGFYSLKLNNLRNGEYSVKVCDARGKTTTQYITIETPPPLQISLNSQTSTFVDAVNGSMNAKIIGGSPWEIENSNYYFTKINDQASLENSESLPDGEYTFSIEDAHGCTLKKSVLIDFSLSSDTNKTSETAINSNNQIIQITLIHHINYTLAENLEEPY